MKILLFIVENPPNMRIKAGAFGISQPLGAGYIASVLREDGHAVRILDNSVASLSPEELKRYVLDFAPDLVGLTAFTFCVKRCFETARILKETDPRIKVVFGGPHATYLPEQTLADPGVDIVVTGEGEMTMRELAAALASGTSLDVVKGTLYKDGAGKIIRNPDRELIDDLDSLPLPAYDLMEMDRYYSSVNRRFTDTRFGAIITSRGCPHQCTFCSHKMFGKKLRMRSPENVADEIALLQGRYGIGELIFLDDTFTMDRRRAIGICDLIVRRGLKVVWTCNTRADHASGELYGAMYRAGCRGLHIGAESASQEMLDRMKKGITVEQITNAVALAKKHIGHVVCGFILGMPGDTMERALATIAFSKRLNPDYATFNIATPVPGSQIYEDAVAAGLLDPARAPWEDFLELFSPAPPVLELSVLSAEDLVKLAKRAFREFYFRPRYIGSRLAKMRSAKEAFEHLRGLWAIMNYELRATGRKGACLYRGRRQAGQRHTGQRHAGRRHAGRRHGERRP